MGMFVHRILSILLICISNTTCSWTDGPTDWPSEWPTDGPTDSPTAAPIEGPDICPDGWINANYLGCFYFDNSKPDRHLSWVEAMDTCDSLGGYLAEIETEEQADFIASIVLVEESLTGVGSWWLGLTDMGHEGRFIWGHSTTDSSYTAWAPGHPNADPHNTDDCVSISFSDNFLWRDVPCYEKTAAAPICQKDLGLQTTTAEPTTTPFPGCPSGWSQLETSCFMYVPSLRSWTGAQDHCENEGGNLTSIHSQEEMEFINSITGYASEYIYIGGTDSAYEGHWEWTDGSAWDFEYWLSGQPDSGTDQDFLCIDKNEGGRWRDLNQNNEAFVCRMY